MIYPIMSYDVVMYAFFPQFGYRSISFWTFVEDI